MVPRDRPGAVGGPRPESGPPRTEAVLSTRSETHPFETEHLHGLTQAEPGARPYVAPRNSVTWLVLGGRALLIWLPVYFLLAQTTPTPKALVAACAISAIWLLGLRAGLSAYFTLGPAVASAAGTLTGLVAVSAFDLWVPGVDPGEVALAETALVVFALSAAWEHAVRSIAKRRVLVVGTGGCAAEVLDELKRGARAPFTMLGLVGEGREASAGDVPHLGSFDELQEIVETQRPDIVILTDERVSSWAVDPLLDLAPIGFRVVGVSHFVEHALGRVPLRHLTPAWFMSMLHLRQKPYTRLAKRAFDLLVSSAGLLLAAPLFPLPRAAGPHRPRDRSSTARPGWAKGDGISRSSSSGRCGSTPRTTGLRASPRSTTPALPGSDTFSARRISTSCPSSGTFSGARCRWSAHGRNGRSS